MCHFTNHANSSHNGVSQITRKYYSLDIEQLQFTFLKNALTFVKEVSPDKTMLNWLRGARDSLVPTS